MRTPERGAVVRRAARRKMLSHRDARERRNAEAEAVRQAKGSERVHRWLDRFGLGCGLTGIAVGVGMMASGMRIEGAIEFVTGATMAGIAEWRLIGYEVKSITSHRHAYDNRSLAYPSSGGGASTYDASPGSDIWDFLGSSSQNED